MDQKKPVQPAPPPPAPVHHESPVQQLLHGPDYSDLVKQTLDAIKQVGNEVAAGFSALNKTLETLKQSAPVQAPIGHQPIRAPRIDDAPDSPKF